MDVGLTRRYPCQSCLGSLHVTRASAPCPGRNPAVVVSAGHPPQTISLLKVRSTSLHGEIRRTPPRPLSAAWTACPRCPTKVFFVLATPVWADSTPQSPVPRTSVPSNFLSPPLGSLTSPKSRTYALSQPYRSPLVRSKASVQSWVSPLLQSEALPRCLLNFLSPPLGLPTSPKSRAYTLSQPYRSPLVRSKSSVQSWVLPLLQPEALPRCLCSCPI